MANLRHALSPGARSMHERSLHALTVLATGLLLVAGAWVLGVGF